MPTQIQDFENIQKFTKQDKINFQFINRGNSSESIPYMQMGFAFEIELKQNKKNEEKKNFFCFSLKLKLNGVILKVLVFKLNQLVTLLCKSLKILSYQQIE